MSFEAKKTLSLEKAVRSLAGFQLESGAWIGDYGGPLFLLPMFVAIAKLTDYQLSPEQMSSMRRYIESKQNEDGGYGLHVEGESMLFTSSLNYIALRLLGVSKDDENASHCLSWIEKNGGPKGCASWGKFFLCLLGLYEYQGIHPIQPELWLLPKWVPIHPSRLWCHCRMVYLPMSFLYRRRFKADDSSGIFEELKAELYPQGSYDRIDWKSCRDRVAVCDSLEPRHWLQKLSNPFLHLLENTAPAWLKGRAQKFVVQQMRYEDQNTDFICIGPISKLYHTLCFHLLDPEGAECSRHKERLSDYLFEARDGLKMNGYNSSQLWDTAFAGQALLTFLDVQESSPTNEGLGRVARESLTKIGEFVRANQVPDDVQYAEACFRDPSEGGWPFSDKEHGWPISDCTAEGLKVALALRERGIFDYAEKRLELAVDRILDLQNSDGGWPSYEKMRGPRWLEKFNPSDCFTDIMVDYSYVECTSAAVQALVKFSKQSSYRHQELDKALKRAQRYLFSQERADGSYLGSWGVCFCYGAWFASEAFAALGLSSEHPKVRALVAFLLQVQNKDGGWGESIQNCVERRYLPDCVSQAVMTSWASLAISRWVDPVSSKTEDVEAYKALERALLFLEARQLADGSFPEENIAGVFNRTCAIHYDNYLKIFPLWAMSCGAKILTDATR